MDLLGQISKFLGRGVYHTEGVYCCHGVEARPRSDRRPAVAETELTGDAESDDLLIDKIWFPSDVHS